MLYCAKPATMALTTVTEETSHSDGNEAPVHVLELGAMDISCWTGSSARGVSLVLVSREGLGIARVVPATIMRTLMLVRCIFSVSNSVFSWNFVFDETIFFSFTRSGECGMIDGSTSSYGRETLRPARF